MSLKSTFIYVTVIVLIPLGYSKFKKITGPLPLPAFDHDYYWGAGLKINYKEDKSIKPFNITFSQENIVRLQKKLDDVQFIHEPLEGIKREYGINRNELVPILKYWRDDYLPRWSEREQFFNKFSHFKTQIQGLNIHYMHVKPKGNTKGKKVLPLLIIHGWPSSVRDFYEIIPKLVQVTSDQDYVFEVIAPSLPGFGWSGGASKQGLGAIEISIVLRNLMKRLGFNRYYVEGGDWGSIIGSNIATIYPEDVIGYHSHMCFLNTPLSMAKAVIASFYPSLFIDKKYESMLFPISEKWKFMLQETGFFHIQATKPDTIGAAISDNPIGLAAYILEKFAELFDVLHKDLLLDNLMAYYITNSFTTSARIYAETYSVKQSSYEIGRIQTNVPTGCVRFPRDIGQLLDWQIRDKYTNLVHSTFMDSGSHFAAMEVPDILHKDFIEFVEITQKNKIK